MPTVLRQDGFRVMIPTHDHPPAHVHCYRGDALVVVILPTQNSDAMIREIGRATKPRDLSDAVRIVNQNRSHLWNEWNKLYGQS